MTPSLDLREQAATLYIAAWSYDDKIVYAEDHGATDEEIENLDDECCEAWAAYYAFCEEHGFELLTEVSGTKVLRCARTKVPLCEHDDVDELESGDLVLSEDAHAAA